MINQARALSDIGAERVPDGWELSTVGKSCQIKNNIRFPLSVEERKKMKGQYPYFGPTGCLDMINEYRVEGRFALIGEDGDHFVDFNGKPQTQIVSGKFNVNNHAHVIGETQSCTVDWFFYSFHHRRLTPHLSRQGAGRYKLNKASLEKIPMLVPPLPEQRKIAEILSTWDAAIEKTEALLATAKAQKRALMQSLLTGKRRFPEFEGQEWKEVRLGDVFSRVRRKNTVGNDNVLTISAQHGLVSQEKYFNKRVAAKDLSGYTLLHHGDFAYNKSYSQGYPLGAIKMLEVDEPGVVSSLYLCFALTDESSNCREYFRHFFEAGRFNHEIYKIAQEGARNHGLLNVSSTDFFRAQINVPLLAEQQKIAAVLKDAEGQIAEHAQSVEKLRAEKKALMQQLLTGKRRVVV
ncbi:restriction endonuclease subunit S [Celeribacter sp.]|uniref:restriction endonuclease subunit S n=1 Tax=Celeribacter sp. TaxID=1890673 RepID=UPI003A92EBDB